MEPTREHLPQLRQQYNEHIRDGQLDTAQTALDWINRLESTPPVGDAPSAENNLHLHSSSSLISPSASPPASPLLSSSAASNTAPTEGEVQAAVKLQRATRRHLTRNIPPETVKHVHWGETGENPYTKKKQWDTGGLHNMASLRIRADQEGMELQEIETDPATGVIRAQVKKADTIQTKKVKGGGEKNIVHKGGSKGHKKSEPYTLYPEDLSAREMDIAAGIAFNKAKKKLGETQLIEPNAKQPLGRFEANVQVGNPPRTIRIQGHFTSEGNITSHYPILLPGQPDKGNNNNNNNNNNHNNNNNNNDA